MDLRRIRDVAVGLCVVALLGVSAGLFIADVNHNSALSDIEQHGIRVEVTVTGCTGLLGGSGSTEAGVSCQGTFSFHGKHYASAIPGTAVHRLTSVVTEVTPSDNPGQLLAPSTVATDRPSGKVYIVPSVLAVLGLAVGGLWIRVRRRRPIAT